MLDIRRQNGIPEIDPTNLSQNLTAVRVVDVRRPDEYTGELGHIAGATLVTLGPDLQKYLETNSRDDRIVFVCRSGARSGQATMFSEELGYTNVANMTGGMLLWNQLGLPVEK